MARLRMAVIGVGHLGKEHARVLAGFPEIELVGVADTNPDQAQAVAQRVGTRPFTDHRPLLRQVDAAVIAVPTSFHHAVAIEFLREGIPLLVEKPLAINLGQAEALVEEAQRRGTILQVGHIERFNPAFEELTTRHLQPKLIVAERMGPYTGRSTDIGVVLDLMIHDLDLLLALMRSPVLTVQAVGLKVFGRHEDVANAQLVFDNGCVANLTASRASPAAQRRMNLWAPEGFVSLDFCRRYFTLVRPDAFPLQSMELDRNKGDQLTAELQDFIGCITTRTRPRVSGEDGLSALALATRVLESIQSHHAARLSAGPSDSLDLPPASVALPFEENPAA
jgi:predicted dehydrogenase